MKKTKKKLKISESIDLKELEKYGFYKNDGRYENVKYYYDGGKNANHKIAVDNDRTFRVVNFNTEIACILCELSQKGFIEICEEEKKSKTDKIIELLEKNVNSNGNIDCKELLEILKEIKLWK